MKLVPTVSVVMPVYNGELYVGEAVTSVLASTFEDFEVLVLDDGSADRSVAEAERAAKADPRVRIIRLQHAGVPATRNAGLHAARGRLIANLGADDLMFPERLQRQVEYLDGHPECVVVGSRILVVDTRGVPQRIVGRHFSHAAIDGDHLAGRGGAIGNPAATFRRDAALGVGGYDQELGQTGEDRDLWLRLAEVGRLANLPEVLTRYRIHGKNVSLASEEQERRRAVGLQIVARAFARRGIVDRLPERLDPPALTAAERRRDAALLDFFRGERSGALLRSFWGMVLQPTDASVRAAFWTIARG